MNKNIIKNQLTTRFLSEESTPGIDVTKKANKESGKINKAGVKDMDKELTDYDKAIKKTDKTGTMGQNKFNYDGDKEKEYHDQMEIMNGQEMIQYDRQPNKEFQDRAKESIEGSTKMGNKSGKGVGNAEATWGASSDTFGKDLVKRIKSSTQKRQDAEYKVISFGDDIETVPKGSKPMAKHSALSENQMDPATKNVENMDQPTSGISEKTVMTIQKWISESGARGASKNLISTIYNKASKTSQDLPVTETFNNGLNAVEEMINGGDFGGALETAKETVRDIMEDEGYPMFENIHNTSKQDKKSEDSEKEENNNNKPQIKEGMKRLNFKKEFNGVGNALKMIPEGYKVDTKVFEMTDGNESYKIRWEGTLSEGRAVVLAASNKSMVNEDMQKMKHLMGYKSETTLGLVKGNARLNENAIFNDIYSKTKALLEGEDIDGQTAPEKKTDEKLTHAKEAKKDIEGSTSDDKGTKAPKAKTSTMEALDDAKSQAPEAKKHVEGSVDAKIGMGLGDQADGEGEWDQIDVPQAAAHGNPSKTTYAPAAKTGEWDKISVPQASDAKKHVNMHEGIVLGGILFEPMK
jgi:hypothetical protein